MHTLPDRLADLADDAPTGGAPAAELWARGKRAHRVRTAAFAAAVLVLGAVGTGIGVRLTEGSDRVDPAPAPTVRISLPIQYPVGQALPDLGRSPGPLAAIWLAPRAGGAPEAVGLVAATGTFGTVGLDLPADDLEGPENNRIALSTDGRRVAYYSGTRDLVVHDLTTGTDRGLPEGHGAPRTGFRWIDATHIFGIAVGGNDGDGWLWKVGSTPKHVFFYSVPYTGTDLAIAYAGGGPEDCSSNPNIENVVVREAAGDTSSGKLDILPLCDALTISSSGMVLGHWNSDRSPGGWVPTDDDNLTVVALEMPGTDDPAWRCPEQQRCAYQFDDISARHLVATATAPLRASFATDLIDQALRAGEGS